MRRLLVPGRFLAATTGAGLPFRPRSRSTAARSPARRARAPRSASSKESRTPLRPSARTVGGRRSPPRSGPASARPPSTRARCTQGGAGGPNATAPPTSEDCLYLNVWTTADSANDGRPVMVWLYGGGFFGGAGSEPRYAGDGLARKGAVVVTLNYRLGALGFFAHPELSAESQPKVSGNYGMLDADRCAAMGAAQHRGVRRRPRQRDGVRRVGRRQSRRGALVASPRAAGLFHRAIAQSGGFMGLGMARTGTLARAEEAGAKAFADAGIASIADARAKPAAEDLRRDPRRRSRRRRLSDTRGPVADVRERPAKRRRSARRLEQGRRHILSTARPHGGAIHELRASSASACSPTAS